MNAKSALIKEFLDGKTLTIMSCFKTVGLTNIGREASRMIEKPFGVVISKKRKFGVSSYGSFITWYEYKLNKSAEVNKEGVLKMRAYLAKHMKEYRPKPKGKPNPPTTDLFDEL